MLVCGALFVVSGWDEVDCVSGEFTSSGPCGIGIVAGGSLVVIGIFLVIVGCIVLYRGVRRPVSEEAGDGWRVGQAIVVMACGAVVALMIPRLRCPPGAILSPVFASASTDRCRTPRRRRDYRGSSLRWVSASPSAS
jgi:hypothetical protein